MNIKVRLTTIVLITAMFSFSTQVRSAEAPRPTKPLSSTKQVTKPLAAPTTKIPPATATPVIPDLPDLDPYMIRIMTNYMAVGSTIPIHATIANGGKVSSSPTTVRFVVRGGPQSPNTPIYTHSVSFPALSPNMSNTAIFSLKLDNAVSGYGDIEVIVDPQNTLQEMNEQNNTMHKTFYISPQ